MSKEVYRISIGVGVDGTDDAKKELSAMEKLVDKSEKRLEKLDKVKSNPAVKLDDKMSKPLKTMENKIGGFVKSGIKKFTALATAASVIIGGIGLGSTMSTYMDFEEQMSSTQAVTRATASEMEELQSTARQLGRDTAWTATEVAQAEELLGQAGFTVQENIAALPGLLNLASAGGLELAEATDIAAGTIKAFGMEAEEAARVSDVLALASSATNADVSGLGEGMKYVGPISRSLGISFEETTAALGMLNDANIKGGQAGTVLRSALSQLSKPSKEASTLMKELGFNAFDSQGNMKPLSVVISELDQATSELTKEQKANAMATMFGQASMSGMLALVDAAPGRMGELTAALEDSTGAAQEMADTRLDNIKGQLTLLGSAADDVKLTLGEELAPVTRELVEWAIQKMPLVADKVVEIAEKVKEFAKAAAPKFEKVKDIIKTLSPAIAGVVATFGTISILNKVKDGIGAIMELKGAFGVFGTGIGKTGLIIGGLVAAGILLYKNWDKIKDFALNLKDTVLNAFETIKTGISDKISNIKDTVTNTFNGVKDGVSNAISDTKQYVIDTVVGIKDGIVAKFNELPLSIQEPLQNMFMGITEIFTGISTFLTGIFEVIKNIFMGAMLIILDIVTLDFESLSEDISAIWENIKAGLDLVWQGITQIFSGALEVIKGGLAVAWEVIAQGVSTAWQGIKDTVSSVIEWFTTLPARMLEIGSNIIEWFSNGISNMIGTVKEKSKEVGSKVLEAVTDLPGKMLQAGKDAMTGLANGIKSMVTAPFKAAKNAANKVSEGIRGALKIKSPSRVMKELGQYTTQGLAVGIEEDTPQLETVSDRLFNVVTGQEYAKQKQETKQYTVAGQGGGGGDLIVNIGDTVFNGGKTTGESGGVSDDDIRNTFAEVIDKIIEEYNNRK